jgi:hypothetical protein
MQWKVEKVSEHKKQSATLHIDSPSMKTLVSKIKSSMTHILTFKSPDLNLNSEGIETN